MTTRVTAVDVETGEEQTIEITDNYVLVREGSCYVEHTEVCGDGTNVLTIRGVRGRRPPVIDMPRLPLRCPSCGGRIAANTDPQHSLTDRHPFECVDGCGSTWDKEGNPT